MPPRAGRKTMVEVRQVTKRYQAQGRRQAGGAATQALDGVSFAVAEGEFVGIMGPSGSGKSTLLNCLATIDAPTSGSIAIGGVDITRLAGKQLARFRRDDLGFIFQDSNLLDTLTAFENIALALTIQKAPVREIDARVNAAARQLGIHEVLGSYPYQLSGGQRQRVAAARATITHPKLVLADVASWVTMRIVAPARLSTVSDSRSWRADLESSAPVGSSASTSLGCVMVARAAATR